MPVTRRTFLGTSLVTAATAAVGLAPGARGQDTPSPRAGTGARAATGDPRPLRLLILGGTGFIGPHVVRHALARGHTVTLFNRGRTNPHLFPDVEKLVGDRDGKLDALRGREWDAVIDNTGYVPRHVRDSADLLRDAVGRYLFTSTRQVYADFTAPDKAEDAPLAVLEDLGSEDTRAHYGPLKVLCEQAVRDVYGDRVTIVRPTAVAGPGDRSDRFTYWPVRIHRGGEVLVPAPGTDPIQYIDVRDLAEFMLRLVEEPVPGAFNVAGPAADLSVSAFVHGVWAATSANVRFTWADAAFLEAQGMRPRRDLPLWTPPPVPGTTRSPINRSKAIAQGLSFRPLAVTARDTLDWWLAKPEGERTLRRGLVPAREAEVLAAWHAAAPLSLRERGRG